MFQNLGLCVLAGVLLGGCNENPTEAITLHSTQTAAVAEKKAPSIASNATLQGGATDLTISAWFILASKTTNEVVAAKDNDATKEGSEYWLGYELSSDRLNFQVEDPLDGTKFVKANSFGSPPTGQWIHVVGWFDRTSHTVNIQVNDGAADQAAAGSSTRVTDTSFSVGSDANIGSFMDGQISNVGVFKRTLNAEERTLLATPTASTRGLNYSQLDEGLQGESTATFVSWWDMSEVAGTRYDSRRTANNLTLEPAIK